ncbi:MDR family MFS transporter [Holzapfeliella sp. He02]|uniref:MDR family MFS transporter n=1 Tax=Holzapfeliella saturejae TaxID=3082953 RepID=A0ABU8SF37_9LACO
MFNERAIDINGKSYNKTLMMFILLLGSFITLLTETFLNNALLTIMESFDIAQSEAQWLSTGYLLIVGLMVPISAWVFKRFKSKTIYVSMIAIFLFGSFLGYIAPNFETLLIGRFIQAIGTGGLMPFVQNIVLVLYPPEKRGAALGTTGLVVAVAPAIGPTLSGLILAHYSWRMLFLVMTVLTAIIFITSLFTIKNITKNEAEKIDFQSVVYSTIGFGLLLYGLSSLGTPTTIGSALIYISLGLVVVAIFAIRQKKIKNPLVNIDVFNNKQFSLTTLLTSLITISLLAVELVLPLYLQDIRHETALLTGLVLLPGSIVMGIMNPITGRIFDKYGIKIVTIISFLLLSIGNIPMLFFNENTSLIVIVVSYAMRMFGISFGMMTTFTAAINSLPENLSVHGNAAASTLRQVAGSLGTGILTMVIALVTNATSNAGSSNFVSAYQAAFTVSLVLSLVGLALSFRLSSKK